MTPLPRTIGTSAPGRICLFGEHQDYLGLPVIAAAIDVRVTLTATIRDDSHFNIELPDIGQRLRYDPNVQIPYAHDRDYLPAAMNVLRREGLTWPKGYDVTIRGNIPLNSGASSSSALQVAWVALLLAAAGDSRAGCPDVAARYAHLSEVVEFHSPGGMMDHYSTAVGGMIWLDTRAPYRYESLPTWPGEFLLVDSGIPKDTNGVLGGVRSSVESLAIPFDSLPLQQTSVPAELSRTWTPVEVARGQANLTNRALTAEARELFTSTEDSARLGELLTHHHRKLIQLGTSHPVIDALLEDALREGALGGKINGSGCGGSFFVLCPGMGEKLQRYFTTRGYRSWIVRIGSGLRVHDEELSEVTQ